MKQLLSKTGLSLTVLLGLSASCGAVEIAQETVTPSQEFTSGGLKIRQEKSPKKDTQEQAEQHIGRLWLIALPQLTREEKDHVTHYLQTGIQRDYDEKKRKADEEASPSLKAKKDLKKNMKGLVSHLGARGESDRLFEKTSRDYSKIKLPKLSGSAKVDDPQEKEILK
ncbi:MAG: hypothetical protein HRU43_00215 [Simkaniaceae bacterium]|nr:hypothetical protein [Simkaniaceae bacterium]